MGLVLASREGPFSSIIRPGCRGCQGEGSRKSIFAGAGIVGLGWGGVDLKGLDEILALGIETAQIFFSHFWSLQYPLERARERGRVGGLLGLSRAGIL